MDNGNSYDPAERLRQHLQKASFGTAGDRQAALDCLAELEQQPRAAVPVYWEVRHFDEQRGWSGWEIIRPTGAYVGQTVETMLREYQEYIKRGCRYELRALYAAPPPPAVPEAEDDVAAYAYSSIAEILEPYMVREGRPGEFLPASVTEAVQVLLGLKVLPPMKEATRADVVAWLKDAAHDAGTSDHSVGIRSDLDLSEAFAGLAAMVAGTPAQAEPINQCDGCQRGLPLVNGIHRGEGYDRIGCTADRYKDELSPDTEELVTDGGRNMFYEGLFDGETEREQKRRLAWANDMRAGFEWSTGNSWFDKDWMRETALWAACWDIATKEQAAKIANLEEALVHADNRATEAEATIQRLFGQHNAENGPAHMGEPSPDTERALFEHHERASNLVRDEEGDYQNPCVQSAWEGWMARASLRTGDTEQQLRDAAAQHRAQERRAAIQRAIAANGGYWPEQLTSGVMFYEGERITRAEFRAAIEAEGKV